MDASPSRSRCSGNDGEVAEARWPGPLTPAERRVLDATSDLANLDERDLAAYVAAVAATEATDLAESISVEDGALALGKTLPEVARMEEQGSVAVVLIKGSRRLPAWQLVVSTVGLATTIPGLPQILAALRDADFHPMSMTRWMRSPRPELTIRQRAVSAYDWLSAGGDVDAVVALIAADDVRW